MKKKFLFVSTNHIYGGSEKLWMSSAKALSESAEVSAFVHYKSSFVDELKTKYGIKIYQSTINDTRIKSWIRTKIKGTLDLKLLLLQLKPDLVVINEGAVFSAYKEMNFCKQLNIPYTVTNGLVADIHWLNLTDVFYDQFLRLYRGARKLIFVSEHNKNQFAEMLEPMGNQMVVKNPVSYNYLSDLSFPNHHLYTIAFVGRFEFYHKGLDLLLSALKDKRWLDRNIKFNFYGDGPHKEILINKVEQYALTFCEVFDSNFDFGDIWSKNQIAIHTSRFEGKSLSITEAMYNKRAIIMTDVGGVSELIKDGINGFVSKSITKEGILSTLERAWEKRDDWQSMGILSREIYDALDKGPTLAEIIVL